MESQYSLTIREHHLDSFGHVNNAAYLEILEEARWEMVTQNGYGLDRIRETGLGPVILEIKIQFHRELRLREKITIESQITSYKEKIGVIHQQIKNSAGEICCTADLTCGLFDLRARRLVPATPEWAKAIGLPSREAPDTN